MIKQEACSINYGIKPFKKLRKKMKINSYISHILKKEGFNGDSEIQ